MKHGVVGLFDMTVSFSFSKRFLAYCVSLILSWVWASSNMQQVLFLLLFIVALSILASNWVGTLSDSIALWARFATITAGIRGSLGLILELELESFQTLMTLIWVFKKRNTIYWDENFFSDDFEPIVLNWKTSWAISQSQSFVIYKKKSKRISKEINKKNELVVSEWWFTRNKNERKEKKFYNTWEIYIYK